MANRPSPVVRTTKKISLIGTLATYETQAQASDGIPRQWRTFLRTCPVLQGDSQLYGASLCTGDHKIHYLVGIAEDGPEGVADGERLTLEAGEYAFVRVDDGTLLRDTWTWLLNDWLPASGRREKNAPEFERYTGISEAGTPIGPIEIWIPLEAGD